MEAALFPGVPTPPPLPVPCLAAHQQQPQGCEGAERTVDAVTRGIDDLDVGTWVAFTGFACAARTAMQHPFVLACARRQACAQLAKVSSYDLLRDLRIANGGSWRVMFRGFPALVTGMVASEVAYLWLYERLRNPSNSPLAFLAASTSTAASDDGAVAVPTGDAAGDAGSSGDDLSSSSSSAALEASAGFIADFSTTIILVPFFFVANRQMCAGVGSGPTTVYASALRTLASVAKGPIGVRGMFAGLSASLLLSTHSAFWWSFYQDAKSRLYPATRPYFERLAANYPRIPRPFVSTSDNLLTNSVAAVAGALIVAPVWNPVMVVRTRMQIDTSAAPPTLREVARSIWRTEGVRGFYKGTCMAMVAASVDATAFATFYEVGKQLAERAPP